jgi:formylglycine-generating enzyme required for sulfatase activity
MLKGLSPNYCEISGLDPATESWNQLRNSREPEDFDQFAAAFPDSPLATSAKLRAASLRRASRTSDAVSAPTSAGKRENPKDGLTYIWIPPGSFKMGCSPGDKECDPDEANPPVETSIPKGFWLGETPVTQAAYLRVTDKDPSRFKGVRLPVENVNWDEARDYCVAVGGRLPTEAEWEYAARAGSVGPRYGDLVDIAWYDKNSGGITHPVAQKRPNAFGLYETLGNVLHWTAGSYQTESYRPLRGASWYSSAENVRASHRGGGKPTVRSNIIGFRCASE